MLVKKREEEKVDMKSMQNTVNTVKASKQEDAEGLKPKRGTLLFAAVPFAIQGWDEGKSETKGNCWRFARIPSCNKALMTKLMTDGRTDKRA